VTLSLASFKEALAGGDSSAVIEEEPERSITSLADLFPDRLPTLREAQDALIAEALRRTDGNQGVVAVTLAISRQALNKRLSRRRRRRPSPDPGD
jgi:two-component system, NtrC family, nitrogen regulation response regulator GlnG